MEKLDRLYLIKRRNKERENEEVRELRRLRELPTGRGAEPGIDGVPERVDYDFRGPGDVVLSGPVLGLGGERGRGRTFSSPDAALEWARGKYGEGRCSLVEQRPDAPRWAVLVRNLLKVENGSTQA